jgi:DNA-binding transcriptional ArsR family regulator
MSGKVVGWAYDQRLGSPTLKAVLAKLADHANDDGFMWPLVETLTDATELSERAVRAALKELAERGLLEIRHRIGRGGQRGSVYRLQVPWPMKGRPPADWDRAAPPAPRPPAQGAPAPAPDAPLRGAGGAPPKEPSLKPTDEPSAGERARDPEGAHARRLRRELGDAVFATWFGEAVFDDGPPPTVTLPSMLKAREVERRYLVRLQRMIGNDVKVIHGKRRDLAA